MREFGLIGKSLSHSFSKFYFDSKFEKLQLKDCSYSLFELNQIEDLDALLRKHKSLQGLNVTIPYKEQAISFTTELSETAKHINAINTLQFKGDKIIGHNTDVIGFKESLKPFLAYHHQRALVFGSGGASKAICYVLEQLSIPYYLVSRAAKESNQVITYNELDKKALASFQILINTTPLGMYPQENEMPSVDLSMIGEKHLVFDLIYNPKETKLLKEAKKRGALCVNGLSMLKLQAEASWKIWNA